MNTLNRQATVPYSARQMFELVNAIEDYHRFLPWCSHSKVISSDHSELVAELEISWKGLGRRFSTRNRIYPYEKIDMKLERGPFKHLQGGWEFISHGESACTVTLSLEFDFSGSLFDKLFQPIFQHIANSLVDAFIQRAVEIYGTSHE